MPSWSDPERPTTKPLWPLWQPASDPYWQFHFNNFPNSAGRFPTKGGYGHHTRPSGNEWDDYGSCNEKIYAAMVNCKAEEMKTCTKQMAALEDRLRAQFTKAMEDKCDNQSSQPQYVGDCKENCRKEKNALEERLQAHCASAQLNAATKCKNDRDAMIQDHRDSKNQLEQENERLKRQEAETSQKFNNCQKAKEKLERDKEELEKEIERLKKKDNECGEQAKDHLKDKAKIEKDNNELRLENDKLKEQQGKSAQKAKTDQKAKEELEEEIERLKQHQKKSDQQAKADQKDKEELEEENERLKQQQKKSDQQAKADQKDKEELEEENERLKQQQKKSDQKAKDNEKAKEELGKENDRLKQQEGKNDPKLKEENDNLLKENEKLKQQQQKSDQKAKDDQKAKEELERENEKLKAGSTQSNNVTSQPESSKSQLEALSKLECPGLHGQRATVLGLTYEVFCGNQPRGRYTEDWVHTKNLADCMASCTVDRSCQGISYETWNSRCRATHDWEFPPRGGASGKDFSIIPVAPREGGIGTTTPDLPSLLIKDDYRDHASCPDSDGIVVSVGSLQFRVLCRVYQPKKHIQTFNTDRRLSTMLAVCALNPECQGVGYFASNVYLISEHEKLPEKTKNSDLKNGEYVIMLTEPRVAAA
ncbi:hypothetical protein BJY04DRAFT_224523 [Aspergillus karnatakaensis]|uniref:uncharacterized protein n=1 Tax=Aspergillus karnatakaensis TaxID=1810916 RepID=UPI003CCD4AAD